MRLIDADALKAHYAWWGDYPDECPERAEEKKTFDVIVDLQPTVDAALIRCGKWQITGAYPHNVYCSECHKKFAQTHWAVWEDGSIPRNFCPHCGARMDVEVAEE